MKGALIIISVVLILSVLLNLKFFVDHGNNPWYIYFNNANTRETYESVHHVRDAQKISTGKGVKVGIIDNYFGFTKHSKLYAGGKDFTGDGEAFEEIDEHGFWMATTLKEIAPGVEVYALNARSEDKEKETQAIVDAIKWAIENNLNVLTYSAETFKPQYLEKINSAVKKASERKIVTTFIHYSLPENISPWPLAPFDSTEGGYTRTPDLNIYHYDYNVLIMSTYEKYLQVDRKPRSGDEIPYFSMSSMSPVLAGFVAILKEIKPDLPPDEYRQILIKTSREFEYKGKTIEHVVDMVQAVKYLKGSLNSK